MGTAGTDDSRRVRIAPGAARQLLLGLGLLLGLL